MAAFNCSFLYMGRDRQLLVLISRCHFFLLSHVCVQTRASDVIYNSGFLLLLEIRIQRSIWRLSLSLSQCSPHPPPTCNFWRWCPVVERGTWAFGMPMYDCGAPSGTRTPLSRVLAFPLSVSFHRSSILNVFRRNTSASLAVGTVLVANLLSGVPKGGWGGVQPSPRNYEGPPKSCQNNPILKTVKNCWI